MQIVRLMPSLPVQTAAPLHKQTLQFQGVSPALRQTIKTINPNLDVADATVVDKPKILKLLRDFYLGEVDAASVNETGYEGQGTAIFNVHQTVIDANIAKATQEPGSELFVVSNTQTGEAVATTALLQSALNGSHQPPADAGQMSYFYKAKNVPDAVSLALVQEVSQKAKALNLKSLFTTARRKGMEDRNRLMQAAGFQEVTDLQRVSELVPPMLRSSRTVVYEKKLN